MSYHLKTFIVTESLSDGTSYSGEVSLAFNYHEGHKNKEIYISVQDDADFASVAMQPEEALEVLKHLNLLLGSPLSPAPFAG